MAKRTRKAVDPKEKLRQLKEDAERKAAIAEKAQEKLKDEENRQFEKCIGDIRSLLAKTGGDIGDVAELLRLLAANDISLEQEIEKLSGEQLDFDTVKAVSQDSSTDKVPLSVNDSPVGNSSPEGNDEKNPGKAVNADGK